MVAFPTQINEFWLVSPSIEFETMAIITLTTDMGLSDYYVAAVKGAILTQLPNATIVDISHEIPKFDRMKAGFILRNAYTHFPPGTVHIVGVETLEDEDTQHVALKINGHFFVGADSGIFSLLFSPQQADEIVQLNIRKEQTPKSFPTVDLFVTAACHIARGGTLEIIGRKISGFRQSLMLSPTRGESHLGASIIYIDSYGNLITNIRQEQFEERRQGGKFEVVLRRASQNIVRISKSYNEVPEGDMCALFNASGYLEISINRGSAAKLIGLKVNDTLRVEFHVDTNR